MDLFQSSLDIDTHLLPSSPSPIPFYRFVLRSLLQLVEYVSYAWSKDPVVVGTSTEAVAVFPPEREACAPEVAESAGGGLVVGCQLQQFRLHGSHNLRKFWGLEATAL